VLPKINNAESRAKFLTLQDYNNAFNNGKRGSLFSLVAKLTAAVYPLSNHHPP
jgi:hypothetical protein